MLGSALLPESNNWLSLTPTPKVVLAGGLLLDSGRKVKRSKVSHFLEESSKRPPARTTPLKSLCRLVFGILFLIERTGSVGS